VGVIPQDWDWKSLGDISSVTAGGTPSRANAKYWNGDIPWVTTSEVDFYTINGAGQFITKDGLNNSAAKLLPPGTLLMALYGQGKTRGKTAILGIEAATNQACAAISLKPSVSREFVFHFLASKYDAIRNLSNTGNQENLNSSLVRSISVLLPPEAEQEAIAAALSDVDALLAGLDRLIAKKRDLKQATMQQLVTGRTRLPGFRSEWEVRRLGEFAKLYQPETISQSEFTDSGYPVFGANGVVGMYGRFNHETPQITISCRGNCGAVNRTHGPAWITGNAMVVNLDGATNIDKSFVYYALVLADLSVLVTGSGIPQIVRGPVERFPVALPSDTAEQTAIACVLSDMDAELSALQVRREKTRALKLAMMQELLTGKTRLVEPEAACA
jgi:type I restriction enzyme S subunit